LRRAVVRVDAKESLVMRKSTALVSFLIALAVGYALGSSTHSSPTASRSTGVVADHFERYKVPIGRSPSKGASDAKVTLVLFSDFQCPFCSRVEPQIDQLLKTYGKDLRVVWKNFPLSFHANARPAAEAALAAGEQGKFWQMHDKLFADQRALDRASLESHAVELGLDLTRFRAALDSHKLDAQIAEDLALGEKVAVSGTPSFFLDGRPIQGGVGATLQPAIEEELQLARAAQARGVPASELYAELTKNALERAPRPTPPVAAQRPRLDPNTVHRALVGDAPTRGPKHAKVTIIEWADYQCPYCAMAAPTLQQLADAFPNDVRVVFKQFPLPNHPNAHLAAEAALAAKAQGKFWPMNERLFANSRSLDRASIETFAAQIGLDLKRFKADLDSGTWKEKADAEAAEAAKIGVTGTPTFYINGKQQLGGLPLEAFKAKVQAAIADADLLLKRGVPAARLYDELMKSAVAEVGRTAPPPAAPEDKTVYKVDAGQRSPVVGPKSAPVTIVEFSDFQCPACRMAAPSLRQLEQKYKDKVRVVFRNYPLSFHANAQGAAEAALAANEQGKFWEMHDKLFANQQALDRPSLEKYAAELGLDVSRFKADLDSGRLKHSINEDVEAANALENGGGFGTPTFFINGRKVRGAMGPEQLAQLVDDALAKARR
jgi:protein-disulfide isomerase